MLWMVVLWVLLVLVGEIRAYMMAQTIKVLREQNTLLVTELQLAREERLVLAEERKVLREMMTVVR